MLTCYWKLCRAGEYSYFCFTRNLWRYLGKLNSQDFGSTILWKLSVNILNLNWDTNLPFFKFKINQYPISFLILLISGDILFYENSIVHQLFQFFDFFLRWYSVVWDQSEETTNRHYRLGIQVYCDRRVYSHQG